MKLDAVSRMRRAIVCFSMVLASGLATVAPVYSAELRVVAQQGLRVLDPIITTAHVVRNHGYMIFDTLFGVDEQMKPQPQMADWSLAEDGVTYTFTLRDGLKFHDGQPVTSKDVVASLRRWADRDSSGGLLMEYVDKLEPKDDKTVTFKLKSPFPSAIDLLAKPSGVPAFIMPERIAKTPSSEAIKEIIGSGPFRFVESEYQPGVQVVYEKFADYVPRREPPSWTAGGKNVKVDRVVWLAMPDPQTAVNALATGEIDYIEQLPIDLLPIVKASGTSNVDFLVPLGYQAIGRMNFLHPPFDNEKIRRAALFAIDQEKMLASVVGSPEYYKTCGAIFGCGTPLASDAGADAILAKNRESEAKKLLKDSGYDGTPVVILHPSDALQSGAQSMLAAQMLRNVGFNVDLQTMDWQTLVTRRASQAAPSKGGWNMFFTSWIIPEVWNPLVNPMLNSGGPKKAWFGWPDDSKMEAMRRKFASAQGDEQRKQVAAEIQAYAYQTTNYLPLGEYTALPAAWSKKLSGVLKAPVTVFWNISKSE